MSSLKEIRSLAAKQAIETARQAVKGVKVPDQTALEKSLAALLIE